ncbi:hypothetical protein P3T37_003074, partial [Kitasatospora sp. MAA4]|uniref:hypothetical protein n=1 Tax=Kitasatospora sp. MAA4 TaxID=3035093 RepID=UPI0024745D68
MSRRACSWASAEHRPSHSSAAGPCPSWTCSSSCAAQRTSDRRTGPAGTRRSGPGGSPKSSHACANELARIRHAAAPSSLSSHCCTPNRTRPAAASCAASSSSASSRPLLSTSPTKAFAELLHTAGVKFAILGKEESCTGDSARR